MKNKYRYITFVTKRLLQKFRYKLSLQGFPCLISYLILTFDSYHVLPSKDNESSKVFAIRKRYLKRLFITNFKRISYFASRFRCHLLFNFLLTAQTHPRLGCGQPKSRHFYPFFLYFSFFRFLGRTWLKL